MATTKRHRKRRVVIATIICVALAGAAAAALASRKPRAKASNAAPSIFKTATVKLGDLTTTESVDGAVQLSSTLTILHRIEGQTSSSTVAANTPSTSARSTGSTGTVASSVPATASAALLDCTAPSTPAPPPAATTTTTPTTPVDSAPPGSSPESTTTSTSTTSTTPTSDATPTTDAATVPSSTSTIVPCEPTTTTAPPPDTSAPTAPRGGTGRTGGGSTGTTRTGSGTTGAAASTTTRVTQTITSIIGPNSAIQRGDVIYTVDGSPVVALDGALPAWRSLSTSSSDGADVAQLEASLVALGYDPAQKVTVDNHFDTATRTMVKAWQTGLGVSATGTVPLGSVVFLPTSTTVSAVARQVGDKVSDGDSVMTLAAPSEQVLIDVPSGDEAKVVPGLQVTIGQVQGTVSRLRSATRNGAVVVEALVTPAAPIAGATNGTAVKVTITLPDNSGVLIAPAAALVSRLDGTYAVQQKAADGSTKWVTVELLGVAGGNVALRGTDLSDGAVLLVPA